MTEQTRRAVTRERARHSHRMVANLAFLPPSPFLKITFTIHKSGNQTDLFCEQKGSPLSQKQHLVAFVRGEPSTLCHAEAPDLLS